MVKTTIFPTNLDTEFLPDTSQVKFGSVAIVLSESGIAKLYTKTIGNELVEIGKGVRKLEDLEDVRISNPVDGEFLIKNGDFWINSVFIQKLRNLSDIELINPVDGQTLIYNALTETFQNGSFTFFLVDLLDFNKPPDFDDSPALYNDHVVTYDSESGLFELTPRINRLADLLDVNLTLSPGRYIFQTQDGLTWNDSTLSIFDDKSPELGGDLNANFNQIINQQYVVKTLTITQSIHEINYSEADYWKINGSSVDCILNINFPSNVNTLSHLILEITKGSGIIQFGNLENVVYNDGRAVELSGQGRTDLIGISHTSVSTIITMIGANLRGSEDNFEFEDFDKNNYPDLQYFSSPLIFDDFFKDTVLLLNFETNENFNWDEDQSLTSATISTVDVFNKSTDIYILNKREYVAEFRNRVSSNLTVTFPQPVVLDGNFTYEFFIQYEINSELNTSTTQTYINTSGISLTYGGIIDYNNLSTSNSLNLTVGANSFSLNNAIRIFKNNLNYYMHFAMVRIGTSVYLFIDGIKEFEFTNSDTFTLNSIVTSGFKANLNSVRLTKRARYDKNFTVPNMKFPTLGTFEGDKLFEDIVMNKWYNLGEIGDPIAYMMYS